MANTQTISAKEDDDDNYHEDDDDSEDDNDDDDKSMIMTMVIMRWPSFFFQGRKANAWKQICQICVTLNLINGREDTFEGKIKLSFMKVRKMASEFEFCFI